MGVFQKEMWLYYYVDVTNMKDDILNLSFIPIETV